MDGGYKKSSRGTTGISFLKHTSLEVVGVQWCNGEEMQIPNPWTQIRCASTRFQMDEAGDDNGEWG